MQGDFYIGERLVQPRVNSIQNEGSVLHLEPKVMQVLLVLASKPADVFTREEIRQVVWRDVFVGDDVLMRAISEIRRAFQDNPQAPHTIQTVPKVGYRLIATVRAVVEEARPLDLVPSPTAEGSIEPTSQLAEISSAPVLVQVITPIAVRSGRRLPLWAGVAIALAVLVAVAITALVPPRQTAVSASGFVSHPLTTYSGSQLQPAISPNGDAVAFVWNQSKEEGHHLYVKALKFGSPVRFTRSDDEEFSPAWSPDGLLLAFIRQSAHGSAVWVMPALGGSEREVYEFPVLSSGEYGGLAWSAEGTELIFPVKQTAAGPSTLVELSLNSHATRLLTDPPPGWNGDSMPAVSPDGKFLAFARGSEQSTRDIFLMDLLSGTLRQLTADAHLVLGLVWTADGSHILFSSNRAGSPALWRVPFHGGTPEREYAGADGAYWPTVSRHGDLLAYSHGSASWSIASVPLNGSREPMSETEVLTSSEQDSAPALSPTGDALAFQSWRSGSQEIWTSATDGSNPTQLTSQGADAGSPSWSGDGRLIAFDARPEGFAHIYITDRGGATPHTLTAGKFNDVVPSWSPDNRSIYFGSNRSGNWQIWCVPADGSRAPQQITSNGGMVAKPSADGKWLYFTSATAPGLWREAMPSGREEKIFDGPSLDYSNYWAVSGKDVYTISTSGSRKVLMRIDAGSGYSKEAYTLVHDPAPFAGLSLSPDGKRLLFSELLEAKSNLTLVEHFR